MHRPSGCKDTASRQKKNMCYVLKWPNTRTHRTSESQRVFWVLPVSAWSWHVSGWWTGPLHTSVWPHLCCPSARLSAPSCTAHCEMWGRGWQLPVCRLRPLQVSTCRCTPQLRESHRQGGDKNQYSKLSCLRTNDTMVIVTHDCSPRKCCCSVV